jgi:ankyrin repeat protein
LSKRYEEYKNMKKFLSLLWLLTTSSLGGISESEFEVMSDQERLRCAVLYEEIEVIHQILEIREYKDNPEKINALYKGETHLYKAVASGDLKMVELLINYGADVNRPNSRINGNGETPLHAAVKVCNPDIVELLLSKGADKNMTTKNGYKPIYFAHMRSENSYQNELIRVMLYNK